MKPGRCSMLSPGTDTNVLRRTGPGYSGICDSAAFGPVLETLSSTKRGRTQSSVLRVCWWRPRVDLARARLVHQPLDDGITTH